MSNDSGKYNFPRGEGENKILPNKLNITDTDELGEAEAEGFANAELKFLESLTNVTVFDVAYIRSIHRTALSHLYDFAGEYRSVNISKGGFTFAAAHVIPTAMQKFESEVLLHLPHHYSESELLIRDIGKIHAELLFIHPFREGNGRTLRILANLMSYKEGFKPINMDPINEGGEMRERYIKGVQAAGSENYEPMITLMKELISAE